jgi:rubrerythrin
MPSLFENAIASIRMGVEDFRQQDHDRDISAVRNFYAGVLLLAKEALIRTAPNADPQHVIGAKLKPVPDGHGGIELSQVGHSTIDFQQIGERAKDFGIALDHTALSALNTIRNDIEHHYTSESATAVRAAISKGFTVAASLFRQMEEDPVGLLGEAWATMLETKDLYDQELREARATLEKIEWHSASISPETIKCGNCQSELVEQVEPDNESQDCAELRCKTCGQNVQMADAIEQAIEKMYGAETYMRFKDAFEDGPIYTCPACGRATLLEGDDGCANCSEPLDYDDECMRCGTGISIQDYLDGLDGGLCSYCAHMQEKVMRED